MCLGDSVTKGVRLGLAADQTFCGLLERRLNSQGKRAVVINSGVGSDTTTGGLKRFSQDVLDNHPTHVVIMFGLNDSSRSAANGSSLVSLEEYGLNLREMIRRLRKRSIEAILMSSNPYVSAAKNAGLMPYIEMCRTVARETHVPLIDTYARFAELGIEGDSLRKMYSDGDCHLTVEGNEFIANLLLNHYER